MRWRNRTWKWKRHFALLPISLSNETIWLEWVWRRFCGDCYEVRLTPPDEKE